MVTKLIVSPVRFQTTDLLHGHIQTFLIQFQFNAKFLLVKYVYLFVRNQIRSGTCDGITFQFLDHRCLFIARKELCATFRHLSIPGPTAIDYTLQFFFNAKL